MGWFKQVSLLVCALTLSSAALALDLKGAMNALSSAKAQGLVGEQADGYLGVVTNSGQGQEIAKLINQARRAEYQRLATQNGIALGDVEAMAGQKAIDKTPKGQFVKQGASWHQK